ncbi:MAG: hypothetical protein AAF628_32885 [Planctomycetota bacterium]
MMDDTKLEAALTATLAVGDDTLARIRDAVRTGLRDDTRRSVTGTNSDVPAHPGGRSNASAVAPWLAGVAAAAVVLVAVGLRLGPGDGADRARGDAVIELRASDEVDETNHYEPPTFTQAALDCDWLLLGEVVALDQAVARFRVVEVLHGDRPLDAPVAVLRAHDEPRSSSRWSAEWTAGEALALALFRDPEDGVVKLRYTGSGQGRFPLGGLVSRDDFLGAWRQRRVEPSLVVEAIEREGPEAIGRLRYELWPLVGEEGLPVKDGAVQAALMTWLNRAPLKDEHIHEAVDALTPSSLRALPEERRDALLARALDDARAAESPYTSLALLGPFARAGVAEVAAALLGIVRDAEAGALAKPSAYGWSQLHRMACDALRHVNKGAATEALWTRYRTLPDWGQADAGHTLALLLEMGADGAAAELVRRSRTMRDAGGALWLDLLVRRPEPEARALLREALGDPAYSLGQNRYRHSPTRALQEHGVGVLLDDLRAVLVARLLANDLGVYSAHDWLELYLLRFEDLAPFASELARVLGEIERRDSGTLQLVRLISDSLGVDALPYREPTDNELAAAARRLGEKLRRD